MTLLDHPPSTSLPGRRPALSETVLRRVLERYLPRTMGGVAAAQSRAVSQLLAPFDAPVVGTELTDQGLADLRRLALHHRANVKANPDQTLVCRLCPLRAGDPTALTPWPCEVWSIARALGQVGTFEGDLSEPSPN